MTTFMDEMKQRRLAELILSNLIDYQTEEYAPEHYDEDLKYLMQTIKDVWDHAVD